MMENETVDTIRLYYFRWFHSVDHWRIRIGTRACAGLFLCGLLAACAHDPPRPLTPSWIGPIPANFSYYPSSSNPSQPHYIITSARSPLSGNITLRYTVTGSGRLVALDGGSPPTVSLMIWRNNDNLSCQDTYQQYRYFGHPRGSLSPGSYTLTIPIDPASWTDCYGKPGTDFPDRFNLAINNVYKIGFTFGGNSAGHGVIAPDGGVSFRLDGLSVNDNPLMQTRKRRHR